MPALLPSLSEFIESLRGHNVVKTTRERRVDLTFFQCEKWKTHKEGEFFNNQILKTQQQEIANTHTILPFHKLSIDVM